MYDALSHAKADDEDRGSQVLRRTKNDSISGGPYVLPDKVKGKGSDPIHLRRVSTVTPLSPPLDTSPSKRRTNTTISKRSAHAPTPLSTIPSVYFEQDFHLENPRTFDVVSERSDVVRPAAGVLSADKAVNGSANGSIPGGRKALATNAILQEKLSWYMDTVEIHLISSISTASTSFFAALGSLRDLQREATDSINRIRSLRTTLKQLDDKMAIGGLKVVSMKRRKENLRKLRDAVEQLRNVIDGIAECNALLSRGEVDEALVRVEAIEGLIAGEAPHDTPLSKTDNSDEAQQQQLLDLRNLPALGDAVADIDGLRFRIGKAFEAQFLNVLLSDLRSHIETAPVDETLKRWSVSSQRSRGEHNRTPSTIPSYLNLDRSLRGSLMSILQGLGRSNFVMPATITYRESVLRQIKSLIRQNLPSSSDDDNESMISVSTHNSRALSQQEKSTILARNLRALGPEDAEELLRKTYAAISEALRRLSVQVKVLLDITSGLGSPPGSAGVTSPSRAPGPSVDSYLTAGASNQRDQSLGGMQDLHQALDMSGLLGQAVDIAQAQITKILKVRSEQSTHLPLSFFLRYFTLNRLFADECEAISGRGGTALKSVVNNHIKEFFVNFSQNEQKSLLKMMDSDVWDAAEIGGPENARVARVLDGFNQDADSWTRDSRIWETADTMNGDANGSLSNGTKSTIAEPGARDIIVEEQKFILTSSAITVLGGLERYEHLISGIPSMTQEVASSLLEYLRLFNSRSSQLILGAGATKSAGLKNITTKHLALASQALSFITTLIPYVREFARRHSPSSTALMAEFDKVKRLYQEHQSGINDKLVDIMSGRATAHVAAFKKINWDSSSEDVNGYMEKLMKETTTLLRVLTKHLPASAVSLIMNPIFSAYREQWGKAFADVVITNASSKQRYDPGLGTLLFR